MLRMVALLLALVLVAWTGVSGEDANDVPIRVGVYLPLTGHKGYGGTAELAGIRLAHSLFPDVDGRPVVLSVRDNKSEPAVAADVVRELIEDEKVLAILGTFGSELALAGGEVAEAAGIPVVGTSCSNPAITQGKRFIFRACFTDKDQGAGAATYAVHIRGFKRAALLINQDDPYSRGFSASFKDAFVRLGGKVLLEEIFNSGDRDFTDQLRRIAEVQPDVLFMAAYFPEGSRILTQAREGGAEFGILGGDSMENPEIIKTLGKIGEGFIQTTFPYSHLMENMSPEADSFTTAWMDMFPDDIPNANAALGYASYLLLKDALKRAGSDSPDDIAAALATVKDLPTPLGPITITESHDAAMPVGVSEIRGGAVRYLGEIIPE